MESGIENANVRHAGQRTHHRLDPRDIGRIVQGRQRNIGLERSQHVVVNPHRTGELFPAMHHTVTNGRNIGQGLDDPDLRIDQFFQHTLDRRPVIGDIHRFLHFLRPERRVFDNGILQADTLHQPCCHPFFIRHVEQLVLERRTAAIQHKYKHDSSP